MTRPYSFLACLPVVLGSLILPAHTAESVRFTQATPASLVNTDWSVGNQTHGTIATNASGRSLVVWHTTPNTSTAQQAVEHLTVHHRWFDASGTIYPALPLTAPTASLQLTPDVATNGSNLFAVTWCERTPANEYHVFLTLLNEDGSVRLPPVQVNTTASLDECYPSVATNSDGVSGVTWSQFDESGQDVLVKFFTADGASLSDELVVNTQRNVSDDNCLPDIDVNGNGKAVITWSQISSSIQSTIHLRTIDLSTAGAGALDGETTLTTSIPGLFHKRPMVDLNRSGDIAVAYVSETKPAINPRNVWVRIFNHTTGTWSPVVGPNTSSIKDADRITVVILSNGDAFCSWDMIITGQTDRNIYGRRITSEGVAKAEEILLNQELTILAQKRPSLSLTGTPWSTTINLTFESGTKASSSGEDNDVFIKTYEFSTPK